MAKDFGKLFAKWGAQDPVKAGVKALEVTSSASRSSAVSAVAAAWAEKSPEAALAWLKGITDAVVLVHAQSAYAVGLSRKDPAAAMDFLSAQSFTENNRNAYFEVSKRWAQTDPAAAGKWLASIEDGSSRNLLASGMLDVLAEKKPQAAQAFLLQHIADLSPWNSGVFTLGRYFAQNGSMEPAAAWADKLPADHARILLREAARDLMGKNETQLQAWGLAQPEGSARSVVLTEVGERIASQDFHEGLKWAGALPAGPSRNATTERIAAMAFSTQPDATAALLLRTLPAPEAREAISSLAAKWARDDQAAAAAWLKTTTLLPASQRQAAPGNGE